MSERGKESLCILGCGGLGSSILSSLLHAASNGHNLPFARYIATVRSEKSRSALERRFQEHSEIFTARTSAQNVASIQESSAVLLCIDPADVNDFLRAQSIRAALLGKLVISVVAGYTRDSLYQLMGQKTADIESARQQIRTLRALPNIAAEVGESITAVEVWAFSEDFPEDDVILATKIFDQIGKTVRVPPTLMNAATAVGGSTPAFFAVICDALIDAAVAVGTPRAIAQTMIYQSMIGTATMLQQGTHPGILKDQGTSPEGCTMAGLMVLEEAGVRGHVGRALREAVTTARLMERVPHVNDTRRE